MIEHTFALIKPDAIRHRVVGNIITWLEHVGFRIIRAELVQVDFELASTHYEEHKDKDFYIELVNSLSGKLALALVLEGDGAVDRLRLWVGHANPLDEINEWTIRGAYGRITEDGLYENAIHASATKADAEREIKLWFPKE